jgi:hypothetical protein
MDGDDNDHESSLAKIVRRGKIDGMRWNMFVTTRRVALGAALLTAQLGCSGAQTPSTASATTTTTRRAMNEFAFIFRATRPVPPDDLPRRNAAARDWAIARRNEGTLVRASPLADDGLWVAQDSVTPMADARPVAAVLVIQAPNLESAVALAKGHPGLAFGTQIEVRPVKLVVPPPP